ncbi:uncharacterized protein peg [Drosophila tropicalis]|uniref:uncharacterized protein peg n=1 Tax=Drosophila tropicalis TaxID=46794 RepID=UPI0035ABD45C
MKLFAVFLTLALLALTTLVQGFSLPDPNVKCSMECDTQEDAAICAADDKGTTKTYRNVCIMKTENCLQNANFQKISDKECP